MSTHTSNPPGTLERDPVCGMNVNPATATHVHDHDGKNYYFCCASCAAKFKTDPPKYLSNQSLPPAPSLKAPPGLVTLGATIARPPAPPAQSEVQAQAAAPAYVCPMCPEVRETKPGACPTCGMALEPRTITAGAEENPELRDMTRRFWISFALTAPLMAIAMSAMFWAMPLHRILPGAALPWLELALATPVVFWGGWPFFQRFWTSLLNRSPNMFTLIGMGTGVAYGYSLIATLAPQIFPESLRLMGGYPDVYFEAAAAITTLVLLGQVMEL